MKSGGILLLSAVTAMAVVNRLFPRAGNVPAGQTCPSDFVPVQFHSFYLATGNDLWTNVEAQCHGILEQPQTRWNYEKKAN
jgi:hypothetical protein